MKNDPSFIYKFFRQNRHQILEEEAEVGVSTRQHLNGRRRHRIRRHPQTMNCLGIIWWGTNYHLNYIFWCNLHSWGLRHKIPGVPFLTELSFCFLVVFPIYLQEDWRNHMIGISVHYQFFFLRQRNCAPILRREPNNKLIFIFAQCRRPRSSVGAIFPIESLHRPSPVEGLESYRLLRLTRRLCWLERVCDCRTWIETGHMGRDRKPSPKPEPFLGIPNK